MIKQFQRQAEISNFISLWRKETFKEPKESTHLLTPLDDLPLLMFFSLNRCLLFADVQNSTKQLQKQFCLLIPGFNLVRFFPTQVNLYTLHQLQRYVALLFKLSYSPLIGCHEPPSNQSESSFARNMEKRPMNSKKKRFFTFFIFRRLFFEPRKQSA